MFNNIYHDKQNCDLDFSFLYSINILRFKGLNLTNILELYYFSLTLDIGVHPSSMHIIQVLFYLQMCILGKYVYNKFNSNMGCISK